MPVGPRPSSFDEGEQPACGIATEQTDRVRQINRGRELVRIYNCYGCHDMDGKRGDLRSQFPGPQKIYGPPTLSYQGLRTQPNWLFDFLKAPFKLRPKPKVRMPTFHFSDDDAQSLVAYFSAVDGAPYPFQDLSGIELSHGKGPEAAPPGARSHVAAQVDQQAERRRFVAERHGRMGERRCERRHRSVPSDPPFAQRRTPSRPVLPKQG